MIVFGDLVNRLFDAGCRVSGVGASIHPPPFVCGHSAAFVLVLQVPECFPEMNKCTEARSLSDFVT